MGLLATTLFFVGRALINRMAEMRWEQIDVDFYLVAVAFLFLAGTRFTRIFLYRSMLRSFCPVPNWRALLTIAWIPPLGTYLPGKVASVVGGIWLLRRHGVPETVAFSVVFIIQGLLIVLGLTVAVPLTLWQPVYQRLPMAWLWCSLLVVAGVVCLHPQVFGAIANLFLRRFRRQSLQTLHSVRNYVLPVVIMLTNRILVGTALWFLARSVTYISAEWILFFVSASALAETTGFLAIFAPAGVGVREGILLIVLSPVIGAGPTAIIAIVWRLLQTIVDVALAGIGLIILRSMRKKETVAD